MYVHKVITPCGIVAYCLNPHVGISHKWRPVERPYPLEGRRALNLYLVAHTSRLSDIVADGWLRIYPVTPPGWEPPGGRGRGEGGGSGNNSILLCVLIISAAHTAIHQPPMSHGCSADMPEHTPLLVLAASEKLTIVC